MVLYEYPFTESIRTMLRLEHLFKRLTLLVAREAAVDHHFALCTLFEIMDVAARADLKSDLLKDLERHRALLDSYRGNPNIAESVLAQVIGRVDQAFNGLNALSGKAGQVLTSNEWLMSIRSRIHIPGGTCEFDLPAYYAWQQHDVDARRADLHQWVSCLLPLSQALDVLLGLVRESGRPQRMVARAGQYQQSLPQGKAYHLMRVVLDGDTDLVPEITGHRLMVSVRLMRADADGRLRPCTDDASFELTLCA